MEDKSLSIFLMVLFGVSGMAVLMLAWFSTIMESERIMATLAGSAGLFIALIRALMLKRSSVRQDDRPILIQVKAEDKT